jgi:hypothetical protein
MSKNLRGYSGMQPIINLVDITASSITATNGTFTNLSIGTYTITTLNVNNLVATGTVILSGLTQQNPLNTDDHNILIHDPTTNRLYKFNSLYFSPINDRLHVPKLTVEYGLTLNADAEINSNHDFYFREITPTTPGDKGVIFWENIARIIGRRTGAGLPELQLVNNTARQNGIDYQVSLQEASTQLNTTGNISFRVNNAVKMEITNSNIIFSNIDLIARDITANDVTVTGTLNAANITFTSANIPGGLTVGGLTDLNGDLEVAGSVKLSQMALPPQTFGYGINVLMWDAGTRLLSADNSFKYYGSTDTLEISNLTVGTAATIFNLNVTNEITQSLRLQDSTSDLNFNIQFINSSNKLRENTALRFNPFTETLRVGNIYVIDNIEIAGDTTITAPQSTSIANNRIPFIEGSTDTGNLESFNLFTFNPTNQVLNTPSISTSINITNAGTTNLNGTTTITGTTTVTGNIDLQGNTTITAPQSTSTNNNRIPFIESSTTTGKMESFNLFFFNATNQTLASPNITATLNLTCNGTTNLNTATVTGNTDLQGDTTISAITTTTSQNSRILFIDGNGATTGKLGNQGNFYYNPNSQTLVSTRLTNTLQTFTPLLILDGTNNGTIEIDNTYGMYFNHATGYVFRMSGTWKLRIESTVTTSYNDLVIRNTTSSPQITFQDASTTNGIIRGTPGALVFDHPTSHNFTINNISSLYVFSTDVYCNKPLSLFQDTNITLNELSTAFSGTKNEIVFNNIGRIRSKREVTTLDPVLEIGNETALSSINYQFQLNIDSIKSNVPTGGAHNFEINNASKIKITNNETIIRNTLTLEDVDLPTSDINFYILLQNGGNNQVKRSSLIFNPVSEILTINKLQLEGTDIATATDNKILFLDPNDEVEKSDSDLTYNASTSTLKFKILDNSSADSKITVQQPLHYGAGLFAQPINYTIRIGHTDLIETIDVLGSGLNTGKYGNGIYLSILRTGVKTIAYGQNSRLFDWNAYNTSSNFKTDWEMVGLPGLFEIMVTFKFEWDPLNTNRANPIIKAVINGTQEEEGVECQYVRQQLGRVITVKYHNKIYFNTLDTISFQTYINIGGTTNFSDLATSSQFILSDFMFMATYLGPLQEYTVTI